MSHVALATYQCPVCLKIHSHQADILLHKRLRNIPEESTFMGPKFCEEHQNQFDQGYVFLIVVEPPKDNATSIKPEDVVRTGDIVAMKESLAHRIFTGFRTENGIALIPPELFDWMNQQRLDA